MASYAQSNTPPASASVSKAKTPSGSKLNRVSIEFVENGFIGRCSYSSTSTSQSGMGAYVPDKEYALADRKSVDAFLDKMLGLGPETEPKKS